MQTTITGTKGFTLIELSIVLVIIGLIVGGVLAGQDLIRASELRAMIAQIEKYNTAVNTFRGKYNALPGDLNSATASAFGFASRGAYTGEGDGNGVIEGISAHAASSNNGYLESGETTMFWVDISTANGINVNLIDGSFSAATATTFPAIPSTALGLYFPPAKIGKGNYVYVGSTLGVNYYGLSALTSIASGGQVTSGVSITAYQAYQIDKKLDDGFPMTGTIKATYDTGALALNTPNSAISPHTSNPPAATDCFDSTATPNYAVGVNNGAGANCGMSFIFQ